MRYDKVLYPCSQEHEIIKEYRHGNQMLGYPLSSLTTLFQSEYSSGIWLLQINELGMDALKCLDHGIIFGLEENSGLIDETFAYWRHVFTSHFVTVEAIEICGRMPQTFFEIQKLAVDFVMHSDRNQQWFIRTC